MSKRKYTIGQKIKRARLHRKMSYDDLAIATGLSTVCLRNLEKGKVHNPHIQTIHRIAKATKVKFVWFFENLELHF